MEYETLNPITDDEFDLDVEYEEVEDSTQDNHGPLLSTCSTCCTCSFTCGGTGRPCAC